MFAYCNSNPVNFVDKAGDDAEAVQQSFAAWVSTAWGLAVADGIIPIGDIIFKHQLKKQGTDPHRLKREYLGSRSNISRYDIIVDKKYRCISDYRKSH